MTIKSALKAAETNGAIAHEMGKGAGAGECTSTMEIAKTFPAFSKEYLAVMKAHVDGWTAARVAIAD